MLTEEPAYMNRLLLVTALEEASAAAEEETADEPRQGQGCCPICLEPFEKPPTDLVTIQCLHSFHGKCLSQVRHCAC